LIRMSWSGWRLTKIRSPGRQGLQSTKRARNADGLAISDITLLELATLASKGRIRLDISLESFLQEVQSRFGVLPIRGRACARAMGFSATYPQDPADRIFGATALVEGLSLLTADREIRRSRTVQTIW
jgi:PIN domain nuclease of toxin-antitoxin system